MLDHQNQPTDKPDSSANATGERAQPLAQPTVATDVVRLPKAAAAIADDASIRTGTTKPPHAPVRTGTKTGNPKLQDVKPPRLKGYGFRTDSSGWACRRRWVADDGKQRQAYVAHLSFETYKAMRRQHRTAEALAVALAGWIAEREREKGS